jgi:hypothetical protein
VAADDSTVEDEDALAVAPRRPPALRAVKRAPAPIHPPAGQGELFATDPARPAPQHSSVQSERPAEEPARPPHTPAKPPHTPAKPPSHRQSAPAARTHRLENAAERAFRTVLRSGGPQAADWVARARGRYPGATPEGLVRLALLHFDNRIRRDGLISGSGGAIGAVLGVCDLARTQAHLVLYVAAAYGLDPTDPRRHAEVVELLRVPRFTEPGLTPARDAGRFLAAYATRRVAARLVAFGGSLAGAVLARRSTVDLADRAMALYRSRLQLWSQM